MNYLQNAVTIITGASSGIGEATARKLAACGAHVVLLARNEEKLKIIAAQIRASGGSATFFVTDVTDPHSVKAAIAAIERDVGAVDILVNNAGLMLFSYWKDVALDDWNQMIDTNIRGYLHCIAAVLPGMLERQSGRILNMDSIAGLRVAEAGGVYGATKFFIRGMTEGLRKEVGVSHGIQVCMVSPGVIDTGWPDRIKDPEGKASAEELSKVAIEPEFIADAVAFALDKPPSVSIGDLIVHPTKQGW